MIWKNGKVEKWKSQNGFWKSGKVEKCIPIFPLFHFSTFPFHIRFFYFSVMGDEFSTFLLFYFSNPYTTFLLFYYARQLFHFSTFLLFRITHDFSTFLFDTSNFSTFPLFYFSTFPIHIFAFLVVVSSLGHRTLPPLPTHYLSIDVAMETCGRLKTFAYTRVLFYHAEVGRSVDSIVYLI